MEDKEIVMAIDFNNVLLMSYFGQPLMNSKGINVNAIKVFFFKLRLLRQIIEPNYIVIASDLKREDTFRRKMYPMYKGNRKPMEGNAIQQMDYAKGILKSLGFPIINNPLYEADDILGMISRLAEDNNMDCVLVSADRDLYQLVTDHTVILNPHNNDYVNPEYMMEKYELTPSQWIDLKILQGDHGDNIPGINGIGSKTALLLMQQFGSIDNIYNNLGNIPDGIRQRLITGKKDIPLTRDLVTVITDYSKLGLTTDNFHRTVPNSNEVFDKVIDLELFSLVNIMQYDLLPQSDDKIKVCTEDK